MCEETPLAVGKPVPEPWTLGGKLCKQFPVLMGFTSTMGIWALNPVLFGKGKGGGKGLLFHSHYTTNSLRV